MAYYSPDELKKRSLSELYILENEGAKIALTAKAALVDIKAELARRYGESAKQALAQLDKDHGTVSLPLQDGFTAKAEVKQEVKWDSAKLMEIARTLPFERVEAMFSIKFSMSETAYKGVAMLSPELRAKIDEARTTIIKPPAITLVKEG